MLGADKAKLESLVADQLSYGQSGGAIQNKKDFVEVIATTKTVYKSIDVSGIGVPQVGRRNGAAESCSRSRRSRCSEPHLRPCPCHRGPQELGR